MLKLTCPHCQSQFTFAAVPPGTPVRCRSCKQSFTTPESEGVSVTPENIFGPAAGRAAAAAAAAPTPAPPPTPAPMQAFAPAAVPVPAPAPTAAPIPAPAPTQLPVSPPPPAPKPEPVAAPESVPVFARKSDPSSELSAPVMPEKPLPKSMRGPLEAETAHVCPQCGLTSVSVRSGGAPSWVSHALGVIALVTLYFAMPGTVGIVIGIAVWALAFIVLNVLLRTTPGFKCKTCAHVWE